MLRHVRTAPAQSLRQSDTRQTTNGRQDTARHARQAIEQSAIYSGCKQVRALGKAPLYAGQPGYRVEMDGDGDGVACEPIRG